MRTLSATIRGLMFVAVWPILFGGCTSQKEFAADVRLSREAAYRQWENRKAREDSQQPHISGRLSAADAVKLAVVHNKMLQQTLEEREVARGQLVGARSVYLPNAAISTLYRREEMVPSFDVSFPGLPPERVQFGTLDNYSAALTVTQPLYAGGAISAQVRAARLLSLLADQTIRAVMQDVVYMVQTAYYDLLLSQHLVEIASDAVRSAKVQLDNAEKRRAGGVVSDFEVLRAQVELSNFEANLIRSKNAINIARANLIRIMGVSQESDFVLSDTFVYVPIEVPMDEAVQTAFTNRPDLYSREYQIRQQREQLRIARSRYLPNISAYFTNTWANPSPANFGSSQNEWGRIWQAGVQGAWPIFDGFRREGTIIQEKARLRQAQINLVDTEETALYELTQAILSMEDAEEFVQSQRMNLTRATEGLRLAEVGYEQGTQTQVEVVDAQQALTEARVNYYDAIHGHMVAKLAVQRAMGTIVSVQTMEPALPQATDSGTPALSPPQGSKQEEGR